MLIKNVIVINLENKNLSHCNVDKLFSLQITIQWHNSILQTEKCILKYLTKFIVLIFFAILRCGHSLSGGLMFTISSLQSSSSFMTIILLKLSCLLLQILPFCILIGLLNILNKFLYLFTLHDILFCNIMFLLWSLYLLSICLNFQYYYYSHTVAWSMERYITNRSNNQQDFKICHASKPIKC